MNMHWIDWIILFVCTGLLGVFSLYTVRHVKSVADFLSANRSAGRYLLTVAGGMSATGAISAIALFEMYYSAGFVPCWWTLMTILVGVIITLTGWVYYRFRETRAMTLAQFFEMRYSKSFRIYFGIIAWVSGLVNFGIFPIVEARFLIYFCGLPHTVSLLGWNVPTVAPIMALTISISLVFACMGGHITVMATDCAQGIFSGFVFVVIAIFLMVTFSWGDIVKGLNMAPAVMARQTAQIELTDARLAHREALRNRAPDVIEKKATLDAALAATTDDAIREKAKGRSMINPYRTSRVKDFNVWFFLIGVFGSFYMVMAWQGSAGYQSCALNPHEAKMGNIIKSWRGIVMLLMFLLVPICALVFLNLPKFAAQSAAARQAVEAISNPALQRQMRVPITIAHILPIGLKGLFATIMVFFLITTQDTYMHSWGSMFIQDVVLPFRKRAFTPKQQLWLLRLSLIGVGTFAFIFGLLFKQTEYILMYFAITGAIVSGAGAVIVGGLYWKRATAAGAWTAMTLGWVLAIGRIMVQQIGPYFQDVADPGILISGMNYINSFNSQVVYFFIMLTCISSYALVSLFTRDEGFILEKMLHRGKYAIVGEHLHREPPKSLWQKFMGITEEFSRTDRMLAYALVIWNFGWFFIFLLGTAYNLIIGMSDDSWAVFWRVWVWMQIGIGVPTTVWFTIGGISDLRKLFGRLTTLQRDDRDDGRVVHEDMLTDEDQPDK